MALLNAQALHTTSRNAFTFTACLTLALGVWRFADPPTSASRPLHRGGVEQAATTDQAGNNAAPNLTLAARSGAPRDTALIASLALTVVLGLGLVLLTPTGKGDGH